MDNASLIRSFVENVVAGKSTLIANTELRVEPIGNTLQLWSRQEGMIASSRRSNTIPWIALKDTTYYWPSLHDGLLAHGFLPTYPSPSKGFYQYESAKIPPNYEVNYTDGLMLLQSWWQYQQHSTQSGLLGMLLWHDKTWYPVRNIESIQGVLKIVSWGSEIVVQPSERVIWLLKLEISPNPILSESGRDPSSEADPLLEQQALEQVSSAKYIGNYLVEAGLLSPSQVDLILSDQSSTEMLFGEIAASRGWLKTQTIEYLMKHLIMPQQATSQHSKEGLPDRVAGRRIKPCPESIHDRETFIISRSPEETVS